MTCTPKHRKATGVPAPKRVPVPAAFQRARYDPHPAPTRADVIADLGDGPVGWHVLQARSRYQSMTRTDRRRDGHDPRAPQYAGWSYGGSDDDDD
jgi:hypothetical protein